jgi:hypothetical protein
VGSGWLAKKLDAKMLEGKIADEWVPIDQLPIRPGREVAEELGGRLLLRYLIDAHDIGVPIPTFVSPTPYSVEEVSYSLALPRPDLARRYVLFLDPGASTTSKGRGGAIWDRDSSMYCRTVSSMGQC